LHCPRCKEDLHETPKSGVLIDVCPRCRGVWLDRGELEKIMGRAREYQHDYEVHYEKEHYNKVHNSNNNYRHGNDQYHQKNHKKKGLLNMLEEFFD
jgi:Zn-finger nucleic acid-binding protein